MILVDTSAWVEFDRATASAVDTRLTELIATVDCMIAAVALRSGASLLTSDSGLVHAARVMGIELDVT